MTPASAFKRRFVVAPLIASVVLLAAMFGLNEYKRQQRIALVENLLSFLLGRPPGTLPRDALRPDEVLPPAIPPACKARSSPRRSSALRAGSPTISPTVQLYRRTCRSRWNATKPKAPPVIPVTRRRCVS